jgi:hypothetical protein
MKTRIRVTIALAATLLLAHATPRPAAAECTVTDTTGCLEQYVACTTLAAVQPWPTNVMLYSGCDEMFILCAILLFVPVRFVIA